MYRLPRNHWKPVPFISMGIPFVGGIAVAQWTHFHPATYYLLILAVVTLLALEFTPISWIKSLSTVRRFLFFIFLFLAGFIRTGTQMQQPPNNQLSLPDSVNIAIVLEASLVPTQKGCRGIASQVFIEQEGKFKRMPGKLLLYGDNDLQKKYTQTGSVLLTRTLLHPIRPAPNPGGFNAAAYYGKKEIFLSCQLKSVHTLISEQDRSNKLDRLIVRLRHFCLTSLATYIRGKDELAIAGALLIGHRVDLQPELRSAYSDTGIIHVIAISGMHMALLFGLLHRLLQPLGKHGILQHLQPIILLSSAWIFCLLTGATPSVLRAACIFTGIVLGEWWNRATQVYNSLAASAICLLIYDPGLLTDAGFQLSYAAVTGILLYARTIYSRWHISNRLLKHIWELISVTMAAQILTLPLLFFHFHRFPLLFVFTNLIAVPLSTIILYLELALLMFQPLPLLANIIGKLTEACIRWMNHWAIDTAQLPGTTLKGIHISVLQTMLLMMGIVLFIHWLKKRQIFQLIAAGTCLTIVTFFAALRKFQVFNQHKLIVYQFNQHAVIHVIEGNRQLLLAEDDSTTGDQNRQLIANAEWYWGAHQKGELTLTNIRYPCIRSPRRQIVWINGKDSNWLNRLPPQADLVIFMHQPRVEIGWLVQRLHCKNFVFDGSNRMWKIKQWKKEAADLHLRCYSTPEQGALVINF
jgi:competence protein ComEC